MSNINGKVYAMNVITPMKPWKTWMLRGFFFILGHIQSLQSDLINLHFIQFARWVIVPRHAFPYLGGPKNEKASNTITFSSSATSTAPGTNTSTHSRPCSAVGLNLIWRWSEKFPGSVPVTPFKELHHQRPIRHRLLFLRISGSHDQRRAIRPHRPERTGFAEQAARSAYARRVPCGLSAVCPQRSGSSWVDTERRPKSSNPLRSVHAKPNGSVYGLTLLRPIIDDNDAIPSHDLQIRYHLSTLSPGPEAPSPLRPDPSRLALSYWMTSSTSACPPARSTSNPNTSSSRPTATAIAMPTSPASPGTSRTNSMPSGVTASATPAPQDPSAFLHYMKYCQLETTFFFARRQRQSVTQTLAALQTQRAVADFIATHQGLQRSRPPTRLHKSSLTGSPLRRSAARRPWLPPPAQDRRPQ